MRRFFLMRHVDETGVSGVGVVAEGVLFSNGKAVVSWLTSTTSVAVYDSIQIVKAIHGHKGKTEIVWEDKSSRASMKTPRPKPKPRARSRR